MDIGDFFDLDLGPARDRWGRPLLIPRGGTEEDRRWYTRASSLADMIEDHYNVHQWEMCYLARGLSQRMDLVRLAAAEPYTTGFDKGDEAENRASKRRLLDIVDRALDHAKIHEKADYGTAVHARTEPGNDGTDPDDFQAREVQSFWDTVRDHSIKILGTELFTANDGVWVAGTFDHLMYVPGVGICITDKKTSSKASGTYDVQLATYANGEIYDVKTDQRMTLEQYVEDLGWDPSLLNRDVGFVFWIKNGRTQIRKLNLVDGWRSAQVAAHEVRDFHRKKGVAPDHGKVIMAEVNAQRGRLLTAIREAPTMGALLELWNTNTAQAIWTDEHTAAAVARKAEL